MYCRLILPSLWRPTAPCECSLEVRLNLDGQPCSVLLHQPQHHQDVPAVQGEQWFYLSLILTFLQPIEFNQIEHERRFKFVLKGIFILITVCVVLLFVWAHVTDPGAFFVRIYFLTEDVFQSKWIQLDETEVGKAYLVFLLFGNAATALAMVTAEICACVIRPVSTIIQPVCSVGFIVNNIPFFTLNFSFALIIVLHTVTMVFFGYQAPFWLNLNVFLTSILVTNKGARAHVATRLRQQIDSFTIGGNNTVHPVVEIALVPLRSLSEYAPTLPTSTRATLCPVEEWVAQISSQLVRSHKKSQRAFSNKPEYHRSSQITYSFWHNSNRALARCYHGCLGRWEHSDIRWIGSKRTGSEYIKKYQINYKFMGPNLLLARTGALYVMMCYHGPGGPLF